jgi:signal peptidase I
VGRVSPRATVREAVPILDSMSFHPPSPPQREPADEGALRDETERLSSDRWHTPPGETISPFAVAPHDVPEDVPGPAVTPVAFSHGGLSTTDPWAIRRPWFHAVWPWGWGGVVEALDVVVLALVMFIGVRFVAHNYIVDGASMVPTFEDSDFLIVNRLAYRSFDLSWVPGLEIEEWRPFGAPRPGDIVVFHFQPATSDRDFIKRVIALPGQTVQVTGGVVYVDGTPLDEPYIAQPPNYEFPLTGVEPGTLFVLGDNRNNSYDSHVFGAIEESTVVGRADFRYWPVARWGLVDHVLGNGQQFVGRAVGGIASSWR